MQLKVQKVVSGKCRVTFLIFVFNIGTILIGKPYEMIVLQTQMKYVRKLYVLASVLEVCLPELTFLSFWLLNFLKRSRVVEMRFILYYIFICPREGRGWKWK